MASLSLRLGSACGLSLLAVHFIGQTALAGTPVFTDITATAGVGLPGVLNESLAWGDYDNDGDQDLYLTNNAPNNLFRNDGGGAFTDVTAEAGVGDAGFSVGTAFGDLDNDGDLDLYVVNFGGGESDVLYRNDGPVGPGGVYVFTDVAAASGITEFSSSRGMAYIDFDRDGLLDIYVNAIGDDILYHNLGGLQFQNVAAAVGIIDVSAQGVGVTPTDVNKDGWVDLFTGNRSSALNRLFINSPDGFSSSTPLDGIDKVGLGMGVLSMDSDNDLDFDLYWTSWPAAPNALYENLTGTTFADIAAATDTLDPLGWGISCNAGDVDNDGWEDFFVTNGFDPGSTPNVLFVNDGDGTFTDGTAALGGETPGVFDGRGAAFADFDNDGDLDLCVTAGAGDTTHLWRNDTASGNHWITLNLVGSRSNRSALGARIEVTTDVRTTTKEVSGGAGRGSFNSLPVEFGLGTATAIAEIRIYWPSGLTQVLGDVAMDQILTVVEPEGIPTVSQWGMASLALLVLTAATLAFRRLRVAA